MTCCSGMAYYATLPAKAGMDRFADPECLVHVTADGQHGIIVHDGSGRYSIIRYCPWCGEPLTDEARILSRGDVSDGAYSLLDEPEGVAAPEDRPVATQWPNPPRGDAPIYNESTAPKRLSAKGRHKWTEAERRSLSEKAKANWAARLAAKAAAAGEGEGDAD